MPHKLLLADDSVTIQRVIELTFADEDIQVIAVGDGQKAIDRIEAERPDIVLADVGMPERDGYEVAAFVKNAPHLAHIPVLLLTGAFEPIDEQRAGSVGCDGVLAKPFEPHMVITRVKELLAAGGAVQVPARSEPYGAGLPAPEAVERPADAVEPASIGQVNATEGLASPQPGASDDQPDAEAPDAAFRISRRTPIAVPGFGAPTAPAESHAALDEYFENLDAAFATLHQATAVPGPALADEASGPEFISLDAATPAQPSAADAAPPVAAAPAPAPRGAGIAQAFSALFAAERGETVPELPVLMGPAALPQASMDDLVERVTRQVLERLSDRVVRDTVTDIVSRVSERLVRDEIERVKATLK
jgi:CheY-like chemotaxis protein